MTGLTQLVQDGVDADAEIAFGADARPHRVDQLAEAGRRFITAAASAPAVGIVMTNDRPSVEVMLGAITCGTTLVSLPLPGRGADIGAYVAHLRAVLAVHAIDEIVLSDELAELVAGHDLPLRPHRDLAKAPLACPAQSGFRLVQFSSGTTQHPKPIALDNVALGANVAAILDVLRPRPGDVAVSWLPLSHDMGLIGVLLTGIAGTGHRHAGSGRLVLLEPAQFLRRPDSWLDAIDHWNGTITASPDFGLRMAARHRRSGALDLSSLRVAIVGGEVVRADTLAAFTDAFHHHGLRPQAICPAYGMAEVGLAVTMTRPEERWRERRVCASALADERLLVPEPSAPVTTLVANGPPLVGYGVRCEAGADATGPLRVKAPSIGADGTTGAALAAPDGWYDTGDTGFITDGSIYVCGRRGDYLTAHARNIYAPAVEQAVGEVPGIRPGRVTAVSMPTGEWAIVAEPAALGCLSPAEERRLESDIQRAAVTATGARADKVQVVERGTLPLTSSGKLQRAEVRARLLRDAL